MLEIEDLSVKIGSFNLSGVNMELEAGEHFVLLGKSGTGKTAFLESLAGRYKLSEGRIALNGRDISRLPPERRRIGFVYQNYELFEHMSVSGNIEFPLKLKRVGKREREKKSGELLELMGISHLRNRSPLELSGGEKQRVAIGRALIMEPELLLLDEPLSALDYVTKNKVKEHMKEISAKCRATVIHVTHDIDEAIYFGDRIGIMKNGSIERVFSRSETAEIEGEDILDEYI